MATAIRRHHLATTEIVTSARPKPAEISAAAAAAVEHEVTIVGTIDAEAEQAELVAALLRSSRSVVTVALRTPYDLAQYSAAPTYLCTYGIHPPSMNALAAALFGHQPVRGRLPVGIPDHYPAGHGIRSEVR
jgi:beta-N-acetylhexosaminidase